MPIYVFKCENCSFEKEGLMPLSTPSVMVCPECGKEEFRKMISPAGFRLKGSGWYATDFKRQEKKPCEEKCTGCENSG